MEEKRQGGLGKIDRRTSVGKRIKDWLRESLPLNKEENILWKRVLGKIKIVSVALGRVFGKIHKRFWGKVGRSFNNND